MTDARLYIAIGVPMFFNALLIALLMAYIKAKFRAIEQRFDDMFDRWRAERHKHPEAR